MEGTIGREEGGTPTGTEESSSKTRRRFAQFGRWFKNEQNGDVQRRADHVRSAAPAQAKEVGAAEVEAAALEQRRFELLYSSEMGSRYHRRRASFLTYFDTAANALILVASATAFGGIVGADKGVFPALIAAGITLISILQVVTRPSSAASDHTGWFRRWSSLLEEIELNEAPDNRILSAWTSIARAIERECVAELRALCIDCENITARRLNVPGRYRRIWTLQRWTMQIGTWQWNFPFETDPLALPPEQASAE